MRLFHQVAIVVQGEIIGQLSVLLVTHMPCDGLNVHVNDLFQKQMTLSLSLALSLMSRAGVKQSNEALLLFFLSFHQPSVVFTPIVKARYLIFASKFSGTNVDS